MTNKFVFISLTSTSNWLLWSFMASVLIHCFFSSFLRFPRHLSQTLHTLSQAGKSLSKLLKRPSKFKKIGENPPWIHFLRIASIIQSNIAFLSDLVYTTKGLSPHQLMPTPNPANNYFYQHLNLSIISSSI